MNVLFVASRLPLPGWRGDQSRAFYQIRALASRHRITVLCYAPPPAMARSRGAIRDVCADLVEVPFRPAAALDQIVRASWTGLPLQAALYDTPGMRRALRQACMERAPDVVHVELARMAPSLDGELNAPRVIDFVDALSLNMARRAAASWGPQRWLASLESRRLKRYERKLCRSWDGATVTSVVDRAYIGDFPNLAVVPNGVDLERFPFRPVPPRAPSLVFSGNLGYFPNVDAIRWFVRSIFPAIRDAVPDVRLEIVGARPTRAVRALSDDRIRVSRFAEDLGAHLRQARVSVAPMRAGSGQSLKVLEAMASGVPVVATRLTLGGIEAEADRHLLIADEPHAFAREVIRLLRDDDLCRRLADEARRFVERRYTWEQSALGVEAMWQAARENWVGAAHRPAGRVQ